MRASCREVMTSLIAALALMFASVCNAATVVENGSSGGTKFNNYTVNFTVPAFNPALGTLNAVDIRMFGHSTTLVQIQQSVDGAVAYTSASASYGNTLHAPAGYSISTSATAGPFNGSTDFSKLAGDLTFLAGPDTAFDQTISVLPIDFAAYQGASPLSFSFTGDSVTSSASGTGANLVFSPQQVFASQMSVTYTYIPEPASLGLLSFAALALTRRRAR